MAPITRFGGNHRMSNVVKHGGTLYLAGQVAEKVDAGIAGQTQEVLSKVEGILREHGFRLAVVGATPYPGVPPGIVVRQSPQAGFQIGPDEPISIEVSR